MKFIWLIMLGLMLAVSACSLGSNAPDDNANATLVVVDDLTVTPATPTPLPSPTNLPLPTNTAQPQPTQVICTVRSDWTNVYSVVRGDTLTNIASRAGTTVQTLAQGNCLANPNALEVGQVLRVPRFIPIATSTPPPTITPLPTSPNLDPSIDLMCLDENRPDVADYVIAVPYLDFFNGCVTIQYNQTVTITWPSVPAGISQVIYLVRVPNTMNPIEIGRSSDAANKFPITIAASTLPPRAMLYAWIGAAGGENRHESDHVGLRVVPGQAATCGNLTEQLGGPNAVVISPATYFDGCYVVQAGTELTINWPVPAGSAPVAVTFYRANSGLNKPDVIGVDNDPSDGFWIRWTVFSGMPPSIFYVIPDGSAVIASPVGVYIGG